MRLNAIEIKDNRLIIVKQFIRDNMLNIPLSMNIFDKVCFLVAEMVYLLDWSSV